MSYPPEVSREEEKETITAIQHYSLANGLVLLNESQSPNACHAPVTLYPTPFPKDGFDKARRVQRAFNQLYYSVCLNEEWLVRVCTELATFDPDFTGKLLETHLKAGKHQGPRQTLTGGLFRSDYINTKSGEIKQVEFNSVSVSFGALSTKVSKLHNYLIKNEVYGVDYDPETVPESPALGELAKSLACMHSSYIDQTKTEEATAILMVVQPDERNVLDQRLIEYELNEKYNVLMYRLTLEQIPQKCCLVEGNRLVHKDSGVEFSVVYYRAGYSPKDYPSQQEWDTRLFLECSYAIQCPSTLTQLSGAKKVQQLLSDASVVKKVAPSLSQEKIDDMCDTFVAIHPLDDETPEGRHARDLAFDHASHYVLKPQREGGGNNIYRDNIPGFLTSIPKTNWPAYILMELINPPDISNKILRAGECHTGPIVSELGVFGAALWDTSSKKCILNNECGWLLRSKLQSSDEGGVAAGFGCIDGVYLV